MKVTKKIVELLKEKDEDAFDFIYEKYNKLVYFLIYNITFDSELSKDLSQDTFIKLLSNLENFEFINESKFRGYICDIARSITYNNIRNNKVQNVSEEELDQFESNENDFSKKLQIYFPNLTKEEVQLLYLQKQCKMSIRDIAEYVGESKSTIHRRLNRIENKLEDKDE